MLFCHWGALEGTMGPTPAIFSSVLGYEDHWFCPNHRLAQQGLELSSLWVVISSVCYNKRKPQPWCLSVKVSSSSSEKIQWPRLCGSQ